ncbi:VWA domain-containing protein [Candidatus Poribacteria bacterium]|nr:VWA domain-containing protein [Candidatus Poribacteria bacterium]
MKKSSLIAVVLFLIFVSLIIRFSLRKTGRQMVEEEPKTSPLPPLQVTRVDIPLNDADGSASLKRNFYFIFDGSGSMGDECAGRVKLEGAKEAVSRFLENIPDDTNLGLYVFDSKGAREVVPLGPENREEFMQAIMNVNNGGMTPLAQSIRFGTDRLIEQYKKQLGYGEFRLVAVTDGLAQDIPDASRYAAKYSIPIYAIGLCIEGEHPLRTYAVSYREANNYEDLKKALEETLAELPVYDPTEFDASQ